jgi:hypothetical protein
VTTLAKDMGILVVAEGVETVEERDALVDLGIDLFQGYLFARPGKAFPTVNLPPPRVTAGRAEPARPAARPRRFRAPRGARGPPAAGGFREQIGVRDDRHLAQIGLDELAHEAPNVGLGQHQGTAGDPAVAIARRMAATMSRAAAGASVRKLPAAVREIAPGACPRSHRRAAPPRAPPRRP